jgi:hypothetical protein
MFTFWLTSHFAPRTSSIRSHRGEPLFLQNQRPSSAFDDKPDPPRDERLKARDLDALEALSSDEHSGDEHSGDDHDELTHHHVKAIHKEMKKLDKLVEKEMKKAQKEVHKAAKEMHLHIGMAAAKHGHADEHAGLEIDELD